jgi:hypothetical protein
MVKMQGSLWCLPYFTQYSSKYTLFWVCPKHEIQVSGRFALDMISHETRIVGMWVPSPLPDKAILLCQDNVVEGLAKCWKSKESRSIPGTL